MSSPSITVALVEDEAGASGYLLKNMLPADIVQAVEQVHAGGSPMSMHIARQVVSHFQQLQQPPSEMEQLTRREHEILALLESRVCVGWHWFNYVDNDPDDQKVDPSNRDSNKGMVSNRYKPHPPLLASMKRINQRVYGLTEHFDTHLKAPVVSSRPNP